MIKFVTLGVPGFHCLWPSFPTCSTRITNFLLYANGGSVGLLMQMTDRNRSFRKRVFTGYNPLITFAYQLIYPNWLHPHHRSKPAMFHINVQAKVIKVWALPRSLATTYGIIGYFLFLRVLRCFSSPAYRDLFLYIQKSATRHNSSWVSPFGHLRIKVYLATPRSFSQLITSFIGILRQGILCVRLCNFLRPLNKFNG